MQFVCTALVDAMGGSSRPAVFGICRGGSSSAEKRIACRSGRAGGAHQQQESDHGNMNIGHYRRGFRIYQHSLASCGSVNPAPVFPDFKYKLITRVFNRNAE